MSTIILANGNYNIRYQLCQKKILKSSQKIHICKKVHKKTLQQVSGREEIKDSSMQRQL